MTSKKTFPLSIQLTVITFARLLLNTGLRMVYPFAPALARGLGVELSAVYQLITIRNFSGFFSPVFGPLSERYGRRLVMAGAILLFGVGTAVVVIWPAYWPLGITLVAISVTKVIYDPAMQAYIGDTVPYKQRGKAISVTELAWSGGLLLGAPAIGFIIARWGWQAPFAWLAGLGLLAALALRRVLPDSNGGDGQPTNLRQTLRLIRGYPVIWAAGVYIMLAMASNESLFIVFGDWMEVSFGLSLTSLGLTAGVIGGAEVIGELFAGWAVDRFGKRPIIITTGLLNVLLYALLPVTAVSLTSALITLFLVFFAFETTVVGGVPLLTEIVPRARGVVMSVVMASFALGRTLGTLVGPFVAANFGPTGNGLTSAGMMLLAVLVLARWVREDNA
ncbi:MAG: MFS transporter [Ardenticatenaceae bacterium]|nr:MFS transporter [Ardenticatenaceae bacterium]MCB9444630.1 MFS transporter [Ardenticatenaceae bacterium]